MLDQFMFNQCKQVEKDIRDEDYGKLRDYKNVSNNPFL